MKNMNLQQMRDQLASLSKLIANLATKDELANLEKELLELKERVTVHDSDIALLKELISNAKPSGNG